mgnify:CR=1 FL=1
MAHSAKMPRTAGIATGLSLLFPITLSTMAIVLLAPSLPKLMEEFRGVPNFEYWVPMILTIPALCVALFSPIAGILGDRFGRRRLLIWSFLIYCVLGLMPVFLSDLTTILISRVGVGITEAVIMVLTTTLIGDYFHGEARDKWLAAQTATASISALVFFNLGGILGAISWRAPFWVYTSSLLMLAAVLAFTWEPNKDGNAATDSQQTAHSANWSGFPWARLLGIVGITIYGSIFFYTVQIQAANGLTQLGLTDTARIGFLTSIASVGVPLGTWFYSRVGRWPVTRLLLIEFGLLSLGFLMMSKAGTANAFLVGCFINQLGAGMLLPTLVVWAMSLLTFEQRGRGAGIWTAAFSVGQWLSPIVVTLASKAMGGLLPSFSVLSAGAFAGVLLTLAAMATSRSQTSWN